MTLTRTASLPIGLRRGWSEWQKPLDGLIAWSRTNGFAGIDLGQVPVADIQQVQQAGLQVGSVDLGCRWGDLAHADPGRRAEAADKAILHARAAAGCGVRALFCVVVPDEPARPRKETFAFAVDGYARLCAGLVGSGIRLAIEGWPGGGPHFASIACTPADYRAFLAELPAGTAGINFDPSHLVRMGIDPVQFLGEFASQVVHVHGKDTELLGDDLYEHGNLQPATFAAAHGFGGHHWRYCIPGHGVIRWTRLFTLLAAAGYQGMVAIELEDERFNGSEAGEKAGLIAARDFLASA